MTEYTFKVNLCGLTELDCFKEATKDELKVLLALLSSEDNTVNTEELAKSLGLSPARTKSAITLFEESGVITKSDSDFLAQVEYEFAPKKEKDSPTSSLDVADSIRDNNLYDLNVEMERLLEKTLSLRETERITSLYSKKGLSAAYILALATFLKEKRKVLTVEAIVREASKLEEKEIDTLEQLEVYINEKSKEIAGEYEMRRVLGISNRALAPSERACFKKWMHDFAYSSVIIGEAYDITVAATGKLSIAYMDSILTGWHDAGCKTLEECRARVNMRKQEKSKKANNSSQKPRKTVETETPKYTDFNSEDALMRALKRSYGEEGGN